MEPNHLVNEYISAFDSKTRAKLESLRNLISDLVPNAIESFSYSMPAYKLNKKPLIYFAAFKNHIGLYATPSAHREFVKDLAKYKHGKGSVQFPLENDLPIDLIKRMILFRKNELTHS
jgi:uncharacterized protein YdhG (YjbR/CyaY superfamily)